MGKFKMKGHTLPGPNQKASVGKNLQDYQMRDGKLVPISTDEFDKILDTRDGFSRVDNVATTDQDFSEGQLVSDKMTGIMRDLSPDHKYTLEDGKIKAEGDQDLIREKIDYYEPDYKKQDRERISRQEYKGMTPDGTARYQDVEDQEAVNKAAAERLKKGGSGTPKKMKYGRSK